MQRIGVELYLRSERSKIGVGQITLQKEGDLISCFMSKFDAVQLSDFFGTGVNGSRVKINNTFG